MVGRSLLTTVRGRNRWHVPMFRPLHSHLINHSQYSAGFDGPAILHQNLSQDPGYRGSNFMGHVISINLDQRLVNSDRIAHSLESSPDRQLSAGAWYRRDRYFRHRNNPNILVGDRGAPVVLVRHIASHHRASSRNP